MNTQEVGKGFNRYIVEFITHWVLWCVSRDYRIHCWLGRNLRKKRNETLFCESFISIVFSFADLDDMKVIQRATTAKRSKKLARISRTITQVIAKREAGGLL